MRLTVLGSAASYAGPGRACSGYLVEGRGAPVLMDCGNGALANAGRVCDVTALDAVVVSHLHVDHFLDLYALQAALRFAPGGPEPRRMPLHVPDGLFETMGCLLSEHGRAELSEAFEPHELADGDRVSAGGLTLTARAVDHDGPTYAFVVDGDGGRLCYTADTRYGDAVRSAAAGCDLLLAECTLPSEYAGRGPHMSPAEAGRLAAESGASRLVLTHVWPTADRAALLADARRAFEGDVLLAEELAVFDVPAEQ